MRKNLLIISIVFCLIISSLGCLEYIEDIKVISKDLQEIKDILFEQVGEDKNNNIITSHEGIEVYFAPDKMAKSRLIEEIKSSETSIYCAVYEIDDYEVIEALKDMEEKGVDVKVFVDSDYLAELSGLSKVKGDEDPDYSHNKFAIIDNRVIITGSTNWTYNCLSLNNNNMLIIDSGENKDFVEVVNEYNREFNELWSGVVGEGAKSNNDAVKFAPEDDLQNVVISNIKKAEKSIDFAIFSFTSKEIADALKEAEDRGVVVRGIFETRQKSRWSQFEYLKEGMDVRWDDNPYNMHNKYMIIDGDIIITGSFNWSAHAQEDNDENVLIIKNILVASEYIKDFNELYN